MQNKSELLKEIFITPSNEIIENRFNQEMAAACNGKCISDGGCRMVVDLNAE